MLAEFIVLLNSNMLICNLRVSNINTFGGLVAIRFCNVALVCYLFSTDFVLQNTICGDTVILFGCILILFIPD